MVRIIDGDTIAILSPGKEQVRIRLAGIDAPEKSQPFGQVSKENLSRMVFGQNVYLEGNKNDRYGRWVRKVIVNGQDTNLEQIRAGLAWHYKRFEREQTDEDRSDYAAAEIDARANKRGLWIDASPIFPESLRMSR